MPSRKSSVACTAAAIAGIAAIAAGSSLVEGQAGVGDRVHERRRRALQQLAAEGDRPLDLLAGLDDLLHEADAVGLGGAELVGAQQVVHGVAPTGALHVADRRPAERREAALRLELAEAGVGRGDDDVAGEGDLDADRERDPLHGGDERLAQPPAEAERVDRLRRRAPCRARGVGPSSVPKNSGISSPAVVCSPANVSTPTNRSGSSSSRVRAAPSSPMIFGVKAFFLATRSTVSTRMWSSTTSLRTSP